MSPRIRLFFGNTRLGWPFMMHSSSRPSSRQPGDRNKDITSMDLLEKQIEKRATLREELIGGRKVRWNYRSEIVKGLKLDQAHVNIWISFFIITVLGFGAFVAVKSQVIASRKKEMLEREKQRKELQLTGGERKKISLV
ncbi:hypothetical protein AB6A40_009371 [Gnathostoma spinigerum]|uniref:Uncharacterized protein n=1 Tax=Gnathostoma spinigerum TaxID=75299 RepID=A0ABD6EU78_9BILA